MRRLIKTSLGVVEVDLAKGWGSHAVVLFGDDGWERMDLTPDVEGEFEWSPEELTSRLIEVGLPEEEARRTGGEIWSEWLTRGGRPLNRVENTLGSLGALAFLFVLLGGWLLGVGFLIWLVVRYAF
jgi:hypothetical protein